MPMAEDLSAFTKRLASGKSSKSYNLEDEDDPSPVQMPEAVVGFYGPVPGYFPQRFERGDGMSEEVKVRCAISGNGP